jgi:hypothetical protein
MKHDDYVVATFDAIDLLESLRRKVVPLSRADNLLYLAACRLADSIRSCHDVRAELVRTPAHPALGQMGECEELQAFLRICLAFV